MDKYGNKYFENLEEELPLRTRWVDYKDREFDPSQIEPGWHAWMSYMVDKPPSEDPILQRQVRAWEPAEHRPVLTGTRSAFKTYNTTKSKFAAWNPVAAPRPVDPLLRLLSISKSFPSNRSQLPLVARGLVHDITVIESTAPQLRPYGGDMLACFSLQ
nr:nadh dehydrogenase [ubiquinone] 1 alpha subcomplex subunit n7bm [Quercus suber]